jgi:hypothetical protein
MATPPSKKLVILSGLPVVTPDKVPLLVSGFLIGKLRIKRTSEMKKRLYMPVDDQQQRTLG